VIFIFSPGIRRIVKPFWRQAIDYALTLPPPAPGSRSLYLKLRDRASYEFALASAAVVVTVEDGKMRRARIALGGVGTKPWRSTEAERELTDQTATPAVSKGGGCCSARCKTSKPKWLQGGISQALPGPRLETCDPKRLTS
jgi:hypothetical protein